uniref:N-acyl-aromatic-L-amino acid amidohydrolase (carboxylate-forming) A-like n=1 Tax=Sinocyclocheilus rhinocerous TaxID=307959 RepID=A0A673G9G2_9TELE
PRQPPIPPISPGAVNRCLLFIYELTERHTFESCSSQACRRSTCCVTCTTPLQTQGCVSSHTPTATGSACTSANTCRHALTLADLENTCSSLICLISVMLKHIYVQLLSVFVCFQREMASTPVRYVHFDIPLNEAYSLDSVGKHGFAMEIGPQPHGVVRSVIFSAMQEGVQLMMDWICQFNSGTLFEGGWVDVYTMVKNIDYPRDSETHVITAAVHPDLQDRDFCLLHPGDPMFLCFSGETLRYRGKEALYPFFINEGAYYEKGVALSLARKRRVIHINKH